MTRRIRFSPIACALLAALLLVSPGIAGEQPAEKAAEKAPAEKTPSKPAQPGQDGSAGSAAGQAAKAGVDERVCRPKADVNTLEDMYGARLGALRFLTPLPTDPAPAAQAPAIEWRESAPPAKPAKKAPPKPPKS